MQDKVERRQASFSAPNPALDGPASGNWHYQWCPQHRGQFQFDAMRAAYRATGGIARVDELVDLFRREDGPLPNALVRWIECRQVICFEWSDAIWLPWFQFHRVELRPHRQLDAVFIELAPAFNAWEVANWFASPNAWLAGKTPVDALLSDLDAVRDAARADRFIANG